MYFSLEYSGLKSTKNIKNNTTTNIEKELPKKKENPNFAEKPQKKSTNKISFSSKTFSPIWLSVSESAKVGGVSPKTVRRAIQSSKLSYKVIKNRYYINLQSTLKYLFSNKKLKNKLHEKGIGQYISKWID